MPYIYAITSNKFHNKTYHNCFMKKGTHQDRTSKCSDKPVCPTVSCYPAVCWCEAPRSVVHIWTLFHSPRTTTLHGCWIYELEVVSSGNCINDACLNSLCNR